MGEINLPTDVGRPGKAAFDWSPDGKTIVFAQARSPHADHWPSADLFLIDVATKKVKSFFGTPAMETSPRYSPDGQTIAFVSSDNPPTWAGKGRLHVVPAKGGVPRALADTSDDFGRYSQLIGWSADGDEVYYSEIQGTEWKVLAMPLDGAARKISTGGGMCLSGPGMNSTRTHLGYSYEAFNQPAEAFVTPLEKFALQQVSQVHKELKKSTFPKTEIIRWKSSEFEIEGLLTYPLEYKSDTKYPLLVVVHGGPMGAFTQTCDASPGTYPIAAFAAKGYCLLRANIRGSSGYGAKLRYANYNDWGGGDYRDMMAGVDHVIGLGVADPDRMGIMGWSYGGYMTSWTITQTDRFRAASVGAGVTNLVSFTGTADIPSFLPDYFGGQFWEHPQRYEKHSAMFQIKGVKTPTLIQHGEKDERVPLSQGQELYNALKQQGCTTKMVIYPRTPHGIEEPALLLDCMNQNLEWFEQHVKHAPTKNAK
jgi:dipeptidyl aminopeptidase/acylaminoacyl peptidase